MGVGIHTENHTTVYTCPRAPTPHLYKVTFVLVAFFLIEEKSYVEDGEKIARGCFFLEWSKGIEGFIAMRAVRSLP